MKPKFGALSRQYVAALRKHLRQGRQARLQPALALGRQAVGLGLETLELEGMQKQADDEVAAAVRVAAAAPWPARSAAYTDIQDTGSQQALAPSGQGFDGPRVERQGPPWPEGEGDPMFATCEPTFLREKEAAT